jgi:pimeloyl-ACP methyl ester carboxylesterase
MVAEVNSEKMVDIGGYHLCLKCIGQETPTVIIDAGAGEGMNEWKNVQESVSAFARVCIYDRAGVGKSDRGSKPRTSQQKVKELRTLLNEAHIEGPYILVGHSIGGLHMQMYAATYPNEVAGIVLVDPSFSDIKLHLEAVLGRVRTTLLWNIQSATAGEGMTKQDWDASFNEVSTAGALPDVPMVVISAGQPLQLPPPLSLLFSSTKIMLAMQAGHAILAKSVTQGSHIIDKNSSHNTIRLHQELIDVIRQVVESARKH